MHVSLCQSLTCPTEATAIAFEPSVLSYGLARRLHAVLHSRSSSWPSRVLALARQKVVFPPLYSRSCQSSFREVFAIPRWPFFKPGPWRSEEHTSELQSLMRISYAVFCLKKKK